MHHLGYNVMKLWEVPSYTVTRINQTIMTPYKLYSEAIISTLNVLHAGNPTCLNNEYYNNAVLISY